MASYKILFDIAAEQWKQDLEESKIIADRARTYVTVVGIVFGYSIFNIKVVNELIEKVPKDVICGVFPGTLKALFFTYLIAFAIALVLTLLALRLRAFDAIPLLDEVEEFKAAGPSDADAEFAYHTLARCTSQASKANRARTESQANYLRVSAWLLVVGVFALAVVGTAVCLAAFS